MKENNPSIVIVSADKTRNYYACNVSRYEKLLTECISNEYKIALPGELNEVKLKAANIARKECLAKIMQIFTHDEAYLTFKDHKPDFMKKPTCRVINPSKTDIGKLSQDILKEKVTKL